MRTLKVFALATLALVTTLTAQDQWGRQVTVPNKVAFKAVSFQLEDVRLLDGPFKDAMVRDQQYLLSLEPDRMLHMFRVTADLPSTATPLGGWESPTTELRGHSMGHYLSAVAIMYASTGDVRFKQRGDLLVAELAKVQAAESAKFHPGYLSAFPEEFFDRLDKRTQVWAPWYTIHKIMAGLLDMYQEAHNQQALDVLKKQAGWVRFRVDQLTEAQQQADLRTEFGGMAEVLANLYGVTGDAEWLRVSKKFDDKLMFDPLAEGNDPLVDANGRGVHGNTQIPKMIASARQYELTADQHYKAIASNFWHIVAEKRSYVIGGNTDGESFFPVDNFDQHLGLSSAETCNTYNMLKLTRHLFSWEPTAEAMDFYERALFNQILPSQDPKTGGVIYYTPLRPGAFKVFSSQNDSFWCCVGTGMENHGKYNDTIYFHDDASLYLNLFIPSELTWKDKGLKVRQETKFPLEDTTKLTFTAAKPVKLALKIRRPGWASGLNVTVNGKAQPVTVEPGGYVTVNGEWKSGDTVTVQAPMTLHVEPLPNSKVYQAFMYGPVVLAGDLGTSGMEGANRYSAERARGEPGAAGGARRDSGVRERGSQAGPAEDQACGGEAADVHGAGRARSAWGGHPRAVLHALRAALHDLLEGVPADRVGGDDEERERRCRAPQGDREQDDRRGRPRERRERERARVYEPEPWPRARRQQRTAGAWPGAADAARRPARPRSARWVPELHAEGRARADQPRRDVPHRERRRAAHLRRPRGRHEGRERVVDRPDGAVLRQGVRAAGHADARQVAGDRAIRDAGARNAA